MPHHKRRRPKHRRAGALAKPHKDGHQRTSGKWENAIPVNVRRLLQPDPDAGLSPLGRTFTGVARRAYRTAVLLERR